MSIELQSIEDLDDVDSGDESSLLSLLGNNKIPASLFAVGLLIIIIGIVIATKSFTTSSKIEIIGDAAEDTGMFIVEVTGAVVSPGVYELKNGLRIDDALKVAGGVSEDADIGWVERTINRAAKITDGQKIFIPLMVDTKQLGVVSANTSSGGQSASLVFSSGTEQNVNINESSALELEELWGIGRVTAQNIIEQRPYSSVEELVEKGVLKKNVYERNKGFFTIY